MWLLPTKHHWSGCKLTGLLSAHVKLITSGEASLVAEILVTIEDGVLKGDTALGEHEYQQQ
jgi:hypothetical protein